MLQPEGAFELNSAFSLKRAFHKLLNICAWGKKMLWDLGTEMALVLLKHSYSMFLIGSEYYVLGMKYFQNLPQSIHGCLGIQPKKCYVF